MQNEVIGNKNIVVDILYKSIDLFKIYLQIHKLIVLLKDTDDFMVTEKYFLELEAIHFILSKYVFEYNFKVDDKLYEFIRIFERMDDSENRQFLLNKIKTQNIIF